MQASVYSLQSCILGEGVIYDHRHAELLWVDIEDQKLLRLSVANKKLIKYNMPEKIGFVSLATQGKYVVGLQSGLYTFDPSVNQINLIYDTTDFHDRQMRWNDGKCSPSGDIWAGTMAIDESRKKQGALYRLAKDGKVQSVLADVSVSNGLAWHDDLQKMYYVDSPTRSIQIFDYDMNDPVSLTLAGKLDMPSDMGYPDGMTIDEDGMLWVAHWDGHCIARWHPMTGQLINKIDIPAPRVTCCTFGGPDKSRLFVSTARIGLSKEDLERYPLSGSIFVIDTNTNGFESQIYGL